LLTNNHKIDIDENISGLNTKYVFFEGNKENAIKHICKVNNLPFYSYLIQPKQGNFNSGISQEILLRATLNEVMNRMKETYFSLISLNNDDYDEIFAKGNTIRRILEYCLKYLLVYLEIQIEINQSMDI